MELEKRNRALQMLYAGMLADSVLQLGREGVLETVTQRKRQEQMAQGRLIDAQLGVSRPEEVFPTLYEIAGCSPWEIKTMEDGFAAEARSCLLCGIAKKVGAPSPCRIYCLNPMEGMVKGLNPELRYEVKETLWEGERCRIEVTG
ncbi:MAG: hypothetical protein HPY50_13550 [Firmicutes bacterium]|nr:hypothetical protein [Bacillota bacterium]